MLKVFIKRVLLGLLLIPSLLTLLLWGDLQYNDSNLLKNTTEYCLASKDFGVSIERIVPDYLSGRFILKGVKISFCEKEIALIDQAVCNISLGKNFLAFDVLLEPFNISSNIISDIEITNMRALCALDFRKGTKCIFLREEDNREIGKILIQPSQIEVTLEKSFAQAGARGVGALELLLDRTKGSYRVVSDGNLYDLNISSIKVLEAFNLSCPINAELASLAWHVDYLSDREEKDIFSQFRVLQLDAQLHNCDGKNNFPPIKQMMASFSLLNNKLIGSFSAEELGKGKNHEICLEYKEGILAGTGILNASAAPWVRGAVDYFLHLERGFNNVVLHNKIQWKYLLNCATGNFSCDISTHINKAKISVRHQDLLFSDIDLRAILDQDNLQVKALGTLQNIDTKIDYQGTFARDGSHKAEVQLELIKAVNFAKFQFQPGNLSVKFYSDKQQGFGHKFWADCDLTNLAVSCAKIAFSKEVGKHALLKLNGIISECKSYFNINLVGDGDLGVNGFCSLDESRALITLEDVCYFGNSYSLKSNISLHNTITEINGETLDLSSAKLLEWSKPLFANKKSQLSLRLNALHMRNGKTLTNVVFNSNYDGASYTHAMLHGYLDDNCFVNLTLRSLRASSLEEQWTFASNNAGAVVCALGLYDGMDLGSLKINLTIDREAMDVSNVYPFVSGDITIGKFYLRNSISNFISAFCPFIVLKPFMEKNMPFTSLVASFYLDQGLLNIEKAFVKHFSHDFSIRNVQIAADLSSIKLAGEVAPSWYGLGNIVRSIPLVGALVDRIRLPGFWLPYRANVEF